MGKNEVLLCVIPIYCFYCFIPKGNICQRSHFSLLKLLFWFGCVGFVQGVLNAVHVCLDCSSQGQEGGGPRHQHGSLVGAAGSGHEPQPAHLPGAGRRAYPGESFRPWPDRN